MLDDFHKGNAEGYCRKCHQPLGISGQCAVCALERIAAEFKANRTTTFERDLSHPDLYVSMNMIEAIEWLEWYMDAETERDFSNDKFARTTIAAIHARIKELHEIERK